MTALAVETGFADILAERGDPMEACRRAPWLTEFLDVPSDAATPLAMSMPHPRAVGSYGAEWVSWMRTEWKVTPRWWQALAAARQLEYDKHGDLVYREIVETGPRRIGKSVRLRGTATWRLTKAQRIGEKQLSMLVSKDLAVGKEIHRGAWRWAEERDWTVTRLNGGQEIEAPDESRWLLRADKAVYGYDVGYGQVDESWSADPQAITDGLEPALLERLWSQLHLTSTAHVKASSLMRRRLLSALRNADPDVLLLFWGAHPSADVAAEATWKAASPHWSAARRDLIARKYAAALAGQDEPEFDDPDPVRGWAAQYLNVWPLLGVNASTVLPNWGKLAAPVPSQRTPLALGISADLDQAWLSLGAVIKSEKPHLGSVLRERLHERPFFVSEVRRIQYENAVPVVIDRKGPASFLIDDLQDEGVTLTFASLDDLVHYSADLVSAAEREEFEHGDYEDLNAAVDAAGWRTVGGKRRAFARVGGDISALEAVVLAFGITQKTVAPLIYTWPDDDEEN